MFLDWITVGAVVKMPLSWHELATCRYLKQRSPYINLYPLISLRITGKFPGYLSPSAGLKFADVPNGLAAISKAIRFFQWQRLQLFKMW